MGKRRIFFRAEYSEADESAGITVEYEGEAFDPETAGNRLSMALVRSAVSGLECGPAEDETRKNRIRLRIRTTE